MKRIDNDAFYEYIKQYDPDSESFAPAAVGFLVGIGFLLLLDEVTPHMHMDNQDEGPKNNLRRTTKLILAVTQHNIPEGMAVGVVYAGWLAGGTGVTQTFILA